MRLYHLPNGLTTGSIDQYVVAWEALTARLIKLFPGYDVECLNPDIVLVRRETSSSGVTRTVDRFTLSLMAANCLLDNREPRPTLREDF